MKQLLIHSQMVKELRITAEMGNVYLFQLKCIQRNIREEDKYLIACCHLLHAKMLFT